MLNINLLVYTLLPAPRSQKWGPMTFPLIGGIHYIPIPYIPTWLTNGHTPPKFAICCAVKLRWLELHLLLRLLRAHNHRLPLEGDCSVRLLLPHRHALLSACAVVVLLILLLLLNLARCLEVILWIIACSNMRGRVGLVTHALAGAARAVV